MLPRHILIASLLMNVFILSACNDWIGPPPPEDSPNVFRNGAVVVSASHNRAVTDDTITIRMTVFPLVSGTGRTFIKGTSNNSRNVSWSMIRPYHLPVIYDTSFGGRGIGYDTVFTANQPMTMEWKIQLSAAVFYDFKCTMSADSVFIADSNRNVPVYSLINLDGARFYTFAGCPDPCIVLKP
jgi:hypothetical protein